MAKQCGPNYITGTYDNVCFYKMEGRYFVRMKPSLSRKRVKTDPAFARTMQYAGLFGKAAKIASSVYRTLTPEKKAKGLYRQLTGKAMQWLKEGCNAEQVTILLREFADPKPIARKKELINKEPINDRYAFADAVIASMSAYDFYEYEACLLSNFCCAPP